MSTEECAELKLIEDSCELQENKWIMKYPWKRDPSCLPDNYVQVLKKLESTERRLMKQPDHASSYDMQVEMEEMKTEQEKKDLFITSTTMLFCVQKRKVHQSELCSTALRHSKATPLMNIGSRDPICLTTCLVSCYDLERIQLLFVVISRKCITWLPSLQ